MSVIFKVFLLCVVILIGGCLGSKPSESVEVNATRPLTERSIVTKTSNETVQINPTSTPIKQPVATSTVPVGLTPTITPAPIVILPSPNEFEMNCREMGTPPPLMPNTNQNILIQDNEPGYPGKLINLLYDLKSQKATPYLMKTDSLQVSPDGKLVAWMKSLSSADNTLIIDDVNGNNLMSVTLAKDIWLGGWFDSRRVFLYDTTNLSYAPYNLIIFDVNSGQQIRMNTQFPNRNINLRTLDWNFSYVRYSPTLMQAFYIAENPFRLVLWDLGENKALASIPLKAPTLLPEPQWSLDGSQAVVVSNFGLKDQFWLVDKNGKMTPLLNLIDMSTLTIGGFAWSPDQTKIAFWFKGSPGFDLNAYNPLAILEIGTGKITYYCIFSSIGYTPAPVWSPDGQLLLANAFDENSHNEVYIVTPQDGEILDLGEVGFSGWILSP